MIINIPQHTLAINVCNIWNGLGIYSALMSTQETETQQKGNSALKIHLSNRHILLLQPTVLQILMCALSNVCMFFNGYICICQKKSPVIFIKLQDTVNNGIEGIQSGHPLKFWFSSQLLLSHVIQMQTTLQPARKSRLFKQVTNICKKDQYRFYGMHLTRDNIPHFVQAAADFATSAVLSHHPLRLEWIQSFIVVFRTAW